MSNIFCYTLGPNLLFLVRTFLSLNYISMYIPIQKCHQIFFAVHILDLFCRTLTLLTAGASPSWVLTSGTAGESPMTLTRAAPTPPCQTSATSGPRATGPRRPPGRGLSHVTRLIEVRAEAFASSRMLTRNLQYLVRGKLIGNNSTIVISKHIQQDWLTWTWYMDTRNTFIRRFRGQN